MLKNNRISLPSDYYVYLVGACVCVFNSNNGFLIENILRINKGTNWHELIDQTSNKLLNKYSELLKKFPHGDEIVDLFENLVDMRNRILHSYRITSKTQEQILGTKTKIKDGNTQFEITQNYMEEFIEKNNSLSSKLYDLRNFLEKEN